MNTSARYILLILGVILSLHFILSFTHEEYGRVTSFSNIAGHFNGGNSNSDLEAEPLPNPGFHPVGSSNLTHPAGDRRANATFVVLARNGDIDGAVRSIRDIEDRFNKYYGYPYVFLNEVPFTDDFKKRISVLTASTVEFGLIPHDHWFQPDWIDEDRATKGRNKLVAEKVIYGGSKSYRNMCRFNSGFFFRHPLVQKYRWYWRIEPDVHFHCDLRYDPFLFMEDNNKTYGFTITMYEFQKTIPTLWDTVKAFFRENPQYVAEDNALRFLSEDGETYNLCHFWSNFEIADMDFWRSPEYMAYFKYLDETGGFYYERWGDAPVHSIAAAIMRPKSHIHFFDDIGYEHNPYIHCPSSERQWRDLRCSCDQRRSFDYDGYSCLKKWDALMGRRV
ncbi:hypothetical protein AX16_002735 [Volvariella volvacea WC 439]|nr:hypothetical protein AX16_002735 [Volvariella volvacea WC 439]